MQIREKIERVDGGTNQTVLVAIMICCSFTSLLAANIFLPSLPAIGAHFHASKQLVSYAISLNLATYGASTFVLGPLVDRFGLRKVLLWGTAGLFLTSLLCSRAATIEQLIALRAAQGVCEASYAIVVLCAFRRLFEENERIRMMSIYMVVIAIAPAIAPIVGGYLQARLGWEANFLVISALAVLIFVAGAIYFPVERAALSKRLQFAGIVAEYAELFRNAKLMYLVAMPSSVFAAFWLLTASAPYVLMEQYRVPIERYGFYMTIAIVAFMGGSVLTERLIAASRRSRLVQIGRLTFLAGCLLLAATAYLRWSSPVVFVVLQSVIFFGGAPIVAVCNSSVLTSLKDNAGYKEAILTTSLMVYPIVTLSLLPLLHREYLVAFAMTLLLVAVAFQISFWRHQRLTVGEAKDAT